MYNFTKNTKKNALFSIVKQSKKNVIDQRLDLKERNCTILAKISNFHMYNQVNDCV